MNTDDIPTISVYDARPEESDSILRTNLEDALAIAIDRVAIDEARLGYTSHSAFVAGLKESLNYLRRTGTLRIKE